MRNQDVPAASPVSTPKAPQEVLRLALIQAAKLISLKGILRIAERSGSDTLFGEKALYDFIHYKTKSISKTNYDLLAAAWLHTDLGRALRHLDNNVVPAFDELMRVLADGNRTRPENVAVEGAYFMYHGSYIRQNRFVVRVVTVSSKDDHILTVTDTIRDEITLATRDRSSSGAMIFFDNKPQVLLLGNENKRGLSLIIGSEMEVQDKRLDQISGAFIVMRAGGDAAYRRCLLIREQNGDPEAMIGESGIFSEKDLKAPERLKHRAAFDLLKRLTLNEPFPDPIMTYEE